MPEEVERHTKETAHWLLNTPYESHLTKKEAEPRGMESHREQRQHTMPRDATDPLFHDEARVRRWLAQASWPAGVEQGGAARGSYQCAGSHSSWTDGAISEANLNQGIF